MIVDLSDVQLEKTANAANVAYSFPCDGRALAVVAIIGLDWTGGSIGVWGRISTGSLNIQIEAIEPVSGDRFISIDSGQPSYAFLVPCAGFADILLVTSNSFSGTAPITVRTSNAPVFLRDDPKRQVVSADGVAVDVRLINGVGSAAVFDDRNRRLLEIILVELLDLKERMFDDAD